MIAAGRACRRTRTTQERRNPAFPRDAAVRQGAVAALERMGSEAKSAVPALIELLRDKDAALRETAGLLLSRLGPAAGDAVPVLIESLKDEALRPTAIETLGHMGAVARPAIPALTELLSDDRLRKAVTTALAQIGREGVPSLVGRLKDKDPAVRASALDALAGIGPRAEEAASDIAGMLKDPNRLVRRAAAFAVVATEAEAKAEAADLIAPLLELLKDDKAPVFGGYGLHGRKDAAVALGKLGPKAKDAVPALTAAAKDHSVNVRKAAAEALKKIQAE